MFNKFGVFINLDYSHKSADECSFLWQKVMEIMLRHGFTFKMRVFAITTNQNQTEVATHVRKLLDEIRLEQQDLDSFIIDCYILNIKDCNDLTLPDTNHSIDVEDISHDELEALGYRF